ncbi:MAG TPA: carboxypeptidase regulatory-like domain-containing protein [Bryobacteraceae bacterium]|jgi:hypothetical protein|nr:carboxypeptidase regulatory-like domain-containing protein [Bryobacteraceae bacterium]
MWLPPALPRAVCALAIVLTAARMPADEPQFCIAGTVVNASTGEPVGRAAVTIPQSAPQSAALTDAAGAFRFCNLPAGPYFANAEKPGFAAAGSRVLVGPSREDLVLRLNPLGVITGRVADAAGEPLENVRIEVLAIQVTRGRRQVHLESAAATDDRGYYRLPNLEAGRYYLRAAGWDKPQRDPDAHEGFAALYYGGAPELASAVPVAVEAGRDLPADFTLSLRAAYRVHGVIIGFSPRQPAQVELLGADGEPGGTAVTLEGASGVFEIHGVLPGSYTVRVTQGEGLERRRRELALQVRGDMHTVTVPLDASVALRGKVRVAESAEAGAPRSPNCAIRLSPAGPWITGQADLEAETDAAGEFAIEGVLPGHYRLAMECAGGYVSAVHMGDTDLLETGELRITPGAAPPPIEAMLATDGGTADVTASGEGETGPASVVLVPVDRGEYRTQFAHFTAHFAFLQVAPGDYQVYAWTGSPEAFEYANPDARQAWAGRAVSVHVGAREHQSVSVKITAAEAP